MTRDPAAAVLALLTATGGYPDLCRTGRYGGPIWHVRLTTCPLCGDADGGCDCVRQAADAAAHLATPLPSPALLAPTGGTR